jgi:hypothetical protein
MYNVPTCTHQVFGRHVPLHLPFTASNAGLIPCCWSWFQGSGQKGPSLTLSKEHHPAAANQTRFQTSSNIGHSRPDLARRSTMTRLSALARANICQAGQLHALHRVPQETMTVGAQGRYTRRGETGILCSGLEIAYGTPKSSCLGKLERPQSCFE